MISIEANMIINNLTAREKKTTIFWSQHKKASADQKKRLADQTESDSEFNFEIIEIEQSMCTKILKLSNHFSYNDDISYHIDLSHKSC